MAKGVAATFRPPHALARTKESGPRVEPGGKGDGERAPSPLWGEPGWGASGCRSPKHLNSPTRHACGLPTSPQGRGDFFCLKIYPRSLRVTDNACISRRKGTRAVRAWAGERMPGSREVWVARLEAFPARRQRVTGAAATQAVTVRPGAWNKIAPVDLQTW